MDITEKLDIIAKLKPGDPWPREIFGDEISDGSYTGWGGVVISEICAEARDKIQDLRNTITGIRFGV